MPRTADPMHYLLRGIDPELWARFQERADADEMTMRDAMLELIAAYTDGAINITTTTRVARARRRAR